MEQATKILGNLGNHAVPVVLLLAEILFALVLVNGFLMLRYRRGKLRVREEGRRVFLQMTLAGGDAAQMVVRRADGRAIWFSDNFEGVLGIGCARVRADLETLKDLYDWRKFLKQYKSWDGKEPLRWEFCAGEDCAAAGRWFAADLRRGGSADGYELLSFRDITDEKQAYKKIEKELEQAQYTSDSKTTFLSRMSHEVRTPMNGIIGMTHLALTQLDASHPVTPYLKKAEEVSDYLLSLLNDILDMSRIEAGKVELEWASFDIYELGESLATMFQKNIEEKGIRFAVEYQDFDVRYVVGDELRLSQVLINFLSNAQKFTSEGEITVTFRQMQKEAGKVSMMIRVHDTGIGMQPEFISRIFQPFEQETKETSRKYGGTGLGMAITDQIVKLMGGDIIIDSMPGQGSDFSVFVELEIAADQNPASGAAANAEDVEDDFSYDGLRILMAEDNELNAEIAKEILEMEGAKIELAENGKEAVDMFASHPAGYYDLILMDVQMPVMDGHEATVAIRQMERPDARKILIFALSADAFVEARRLSARMGMDGHFAKPIDFDDMRREIGRIVRERQAHI